MRETELVLIERHPGGREVPDKETLRAIVTAWLRQELEK